MPTNTERRLEQLENLLLFGGGVAAGTASGRQLAAAAARRAPAAALGMARRHPVATAAAIAYVAYKEGLSIETATDLIQREYEAQTDQPQFFVQEQIKEQIRDAIPAAIDLAGRLVPAAVPGKRRTRQLGEPLVTLATLGAYRKRKVSKANRAVKHAMGLLKAGPKRSTGADKGKLPKGAFKMATKAAGLANKNTRSKIGKGKGKVKALARKLRKWW